jgi:hypothetical protein
MRGSRIDICEDKPWSISTPRCDAPSGQNQGCAASRPRRAKPLATAAGSRAGAARTAPRARARTRTWPPGERVQARRSWRAQRSPWCGAQRGACAAARCGALAVAAAAAGDGEQCRRMRGAKVKAACRPLSAMSTSASPRRRCAAAADAERRTRAVCRRWLSAMLHTEDVGAAQHERQAVNARRQRRGRA